MPSWLEYLSNINHHSRKIPTFKSLPWKCRGHNYKLQHLISWLKGQIFKITKDIDINSKIKPTKRHSNPVLEKNPHSQSYVYFKIPKLISNSLRLTKINLTYFLETGRKWKKQRLFQNWRVVLACNKAYIKKKSYSFF